MADNNKGYEETCGESEREREKKLVSRRNGYWQNRGGKKYILKPEMKRRGMEDVSKSQAFHNQFLVKTKKERTAPENASWLCLSDNIVCISVHSLSSEAALISTGRDEISD